MTDNKNIVYCYTPKPVANVGSNQEALIIAIIFICVVLLLTLYAVHHKFFDVYIEKARVNLCNGKTSAEPATKQSPDDLQKQRVAYLSNPLE